MAAQGGGFRQNLAEARTSAVEMGLRVADGPIEHRGDFRMFVALDVVENDDEFLGRAEFFERALEMKAIQRRGKMRIG